MEEPQVIEDSEDEGSLEYAGTPCSMCRSKRRGCDRVKPTCGTCTKNGQEISCSYRPEDMPRPYAKTQGDKELEPSPTFVEAKSDSSEPPRAAKRLRSTSARSTKESVTPAKRPRRQRYESTSDEESSEKELKTAETPDDIQLPDGPNETDLLRWDLVKIIHNKPAAASLEAPTLECLLQVLQQDHPSYSEDELQEKAEFSVMLQERLDGPKKGGRLSNSDMRVLQFILKVPFMDRSVVDVHEKDVCLGIFTSFMSGGRQRPMKNSSPAGLRLLHRVIRKSDLKPRDKPVLNELNDALETGVTMSRAALRDCVDIILRSKTPAANQVGISTRSQICQSEHVTQAQMPERTVQAERLSARLSASNSKPPVVTPRPTLSDRLSDAELILRRESLNALPDPKPTSQLSESLAALLFEIYCHSDYPLLPIVDLLAFKPYQAPLKFQGGAIQSSQAGPLNFCHALGCLSTDDPRALEHAPTLYQAARASMHSIENSEDLLSLVQCQVLQSQYLRAVGNLTSAWEVIGLAIRGAYTLSIKAKSDKHFDPDSTSNKLAMRLWHSMQMMERSLALDLGLTYRGMDSIFNAAFPSDTWVDGIPGLAENDRGTGICVSKFLYASHNLHVIMDELIDFEEELRLSNGQCALKKIKEADLREFVDMEAKLESWHASLPTVLQDSSQPDDPSPLVGRLRSVLLLRYLYFKIRLYRPLMILGVALSTTCACDAEHGPHMRRQNQYGKNGISGLTIIKDASSKCLHLAGRLTARLWEYKGSTFLPNDTSACEYLHYAYACGLVMIAARGLHFITDSKEVPVDHAKFEKILRLLKTGDKNMVKDNDRSHLFSVCRQALRDLSKRAGEPDKSALISEGVDFEKPAWHKLYARTRVDPPRPPNPRLPDISRLLGWFESLPVDLMA
ncbi:fungal specific transcription factor [Penicillium sp. IBT 16267x]|nr:fungal specific transcription factor [Penicillium sp. IBT 16267x]